MVWNALSVIDQLITVVRKVAESDNPRCVKSTGPETSP